MPKFILCLLFHNGNLNFSCWITLSMSNKCPLFAKNDFMVTAETWEEALFYRFLVCGYPANTQSCHFFIVCVAVLQQEIHLPSGQSTSLCQALASCPSPAETALSLLLASSLETTVGISLTATVCTSGVHAITRLKHRTLGWKTLESTVTSSTLAQLFARHTHECCRWYCLLNLPLNSIPCEQFS